MVDFPSFYNNFKFKYSLKTVHYFLAQRVSGFQAISDQDSPVLRNEKNQILFDLKLRGPKKERIKRYF